MSSGIAIGFSVLSILLGIIAAGPLLVRLLGKKPILRP